MTDTNDSNPIRNRVVLAIKEMTAEPRISASMVAEHIVNGVVFSDPIHREAARLHYEAEAVVVLKSALLRLNIDHMTGEEVERVVRLIHSRAPSMPEFVQMVRETFEMPEAPDA